MTHFSAQEWATLITAALGALGAFVVGVIHALRSEAKSEEIKARLGAVESRQITHEVNAERRATGESGCSE